MRVFDDVATPPDPEEQWRAHGWGTEWKFPARGPAGDPLLVKWRAPLDLVRVDVRAIREDAPAGTVAQTVRRLAGVIGSSKDVAALGIEHTVARDSAPDIYVYATITVAVHDVPGATRGSAADGEVTFLQLNTPGGRYPSTRTLSWCSAAVVPGRPPLELLTIRYVARTPYGHLTLALATPQMEVVQLLPGLDTMATGFWLEPLH